MPEQVKKTPYSLGLLAHVDAGKTTLSEALLYTSGARRTLGRVDHKDAFLDTHDLERARGITIFSKQARLETESLAVTLVDTPGHVDFSTEAERTMPILDCAVLVISGTDGIQAHSLTLWRLLAKPRRIVLWILAPTFDVSAHRSHHHEHRTLSPGDRFRHQRKTFGKIRRFQRFESGKLGIGQRHAAIVAANERLAVRSYRLRTVFDFIAEFEALLAAFAQIKSKALYFGVAMGLLPMAHRIVDGIAQYSQASGGILKSLFVDLIQVFIPNTHQARLAVLHVRRLADDECAVDLSVSIGNPAKMARRIDVLDQLAVPVDFRKSFLMGKINARLRACKTLDMSGFEQHVKFMRNGQDRLHLCRTRRHSQ